MLPFLDSEYKVNFLDIKSDRDEVAGVLMQNKGGLFLAGKIKEIIDTIIQERSKGNFAIREMTKAKFILKGINPDKFDSFTEDDPVIIDKLLSIAKQLYIKNMEDKNSNIKSVSSIKSNEKEAVSDIKNQLNGFGIKLVVFFASSIFDQERLSNLMQEAFRGCVVFGCSTAGERLNKELLKNAVVAMAFNSNIISDAKVEVIEQMKENLSVEAAFTSFERYFNESSYTMDETRYAGIVLIDGVSMKEEKLMDQIGNRTNVYFVGGSAGDDLKFNKTFVYANGKAYTDSAVLVLLKLNDQAEFSIIKTQSFKSLDHVFIANKVHEETREVIEFNNKPAILAYADAVGAASVEETPKYFTTNPVGLLIGENEIFVRSPRQKIGTNIKFYCNILQGMEVRLLESTNIIEDTKNALEKKINEFGKLEGIISFDCIERILELEKRNLVKKYGEIFSSIPTIGFSTYGEEYIGHINQTATMLVFKTNTTKPDNEQDALFRIETHQKEKYMEQAYEKLVKENNHLHKELLERNQQLEETTAALKEFNIMLEEEINERTKTEEALRLAGDQFSRVFHSSPYMMIIRRKSDNCCIDVNDRYLSTMGYSRHEIIGKTPEEVGIGEIDYEKIINIINEQGRVDNLECSSWTKQGKITLILSAEEIEINGEQCILFVVNDITEIKRLQIELAHLDRLHLIGQMAAGIAHEVRNPMTTVRGYLQLLQNKKEFQSFESQFALMLDEIDRANSIITEFLSLAKTKPSETKKCDLNSIITKLFPLIQADAFTKNMEIIYEPGEIPFIELNTKEIHQLILNLCRNGLEAMKPGGTLMLKTFRDEQNVVLSVEDEGIGIPIESLDKLGKPFFSTKNNGTGLGLASCYNIATRHNAIIDIDTSPNGTTFFVRFTCGEFNT